MYLGRRHPVPSRTNGEEVLMAEQLDTSQGWCCDGRTWKEHADESGQCCQPQGMQITDLPPEGQEKARQREAQAAG
jgi:hypothetical protein